MPPFLNTWKDADVICSPSCMFCCSWFCIVIFFSLVIEAMGKLRTTVCSPTTGRQGSDSAIAVYSSFLESLLLISPAFAGEMYLERQCPGMQQENDHDSRIAFINCAAWQFIPQIQSFPGVKKLSLPVNLHSSSPAYSVPHRIIWFKAT